jgi:16S rRNA C1402 (ribose-2'-O) methylase RsmI
MFDTQTYATIYQYDLHSDQNNIDEINRILLEESKTKKILVLSDEGSSIFLEPASELKSLLNKKNIPFQYIPGPNSVITGICVSRSIVTDFYFGGSLPPISKKKRLELFKKIKDNNLPTIFLLTAVDSRDCVEDVMNFFGDGWNVEFLMNLTMETEKTMLGSFRDILAYIDNNSSYFERDEPHKKFAMNVFPLHFTKYTSQDYYDDKKRQVN